LEGVDAVVHLAGRNLAEGRWTDERKSEIRDSRVHGTWLLSNALAEMARPPRVLICASAIGYYGDRGDETLTEESVPGEGFLPDICVEWEQASEPARQAGIRVVNMRIGVVLARDGGALAKMVLPFRFGLGGRHGTGRQYMSWIALDDVVAAIAYLLSAEDTHGAVNVVSPNPVTNSQFTIALGRALGRPTVLHVPAFVLRAAFGQMGEELMLSSTRVEPARLKASPFEFRYAELDEALRSLTRP